MASYLLDPNDVLDFAVDWTDWLETGETITAKTVNATAGVTVDSHSEAAGVVTVWLSGGVLNARAIVTCHVTTSNARQADQSFGVLVAQR